MHRVTCDCIECSNRREADQLSTIVGIAYGIVLSMMLYGIFAIVLD